MGLVDMYGNPEGPEEAPPAPTRRSSRMNMRSRASILKRKDAQHRARMAAAAERSIRRRKKAARRGGLKTVPTLAEAMKGRGETPFQREKRRTIQRETSPAARRRMKEQEGLAFPGGN